MPISDQVFANQPRRLKTSFGKTKFAMFFDPKNEASNRLDDKARKVLSGTGAFGRGFMRRSIKKAGKRYVAHEHAGPPRYHSRGFASLKDGIFFFLGEDENSVVIGPNLLRKTNVDPTTKASGAQLLEEGGGATIKTFRHNQGRVVAQRRERVPTGKKGKFRTRNVTVRAERPGQWKTRRARYRKRPYVGPTMDPAQERMKELTEKVDA